MMLSMVVSVLSRWATEITVRFSSSKSIADCTSASDCESSEAVARALFGAPALSQPPNLVLPAPGREHESALGEIARAQRPFWQLG